MKLYSTNNTKHLVDLKEAVLKGLPEDDGLYMPCQIPVLQDGFISGIKSHTLPEIAFEVCKTMFDGYINEADLSDIIKQSIDFPAPIVSFNKDMHVLELFHGPSMAFKDFGARFMGQLMGYFNKGESQELNILVATSGDTGGAVAAGFLDAPGINVYILYPSGKVSEIQEMQLTTLGKNIKALEVDGTFDDCQRLVKSAFLDQELRNKMRLASANSINIARLIPQSFYYFEAYKQLEDHSKEVVFSIPSGNFGNLTAGIFAHKMGLPVQQFLAATNINDIIPHYLLTGEYIAKPSLATISNAMDVGDPSNYKRLADIFKQDGSTWNNMKELLSGYSYDDAQTRDSIKEIYDKYGYIIDPHGAIGYSALKEYQKEHDVNGIILETAHYAKFKPTMDNALGFDVPIPQKLSVLLGKEKVARSMSIKFNDFKSYMLEQ
jgi:threonine synthase